MWRALLMLSATVTSIATATAGAAVPASAFSSSLQAVQSTFELDGNTASNGGVDWNSLFSSTPSNPATWGAAPANLIGRTFAADDFSPSDDHTYFKGSATDNDQVGNWQCVVQSNATNKDDLFNAYAAVFASPVNGSQHEVLYVASERNVNTGDSFAGFWILQDPGVGCSAPAIGSSSFSGHHVEGDLLLLADYTNGGSVAALNVYQWHNGAPTPVAAITGGDCQNAAANPGWLSCGRTNGSPISTPWAPGNGTQLASDTFVEVGVDLTQAFGGAVPCGAKLLSETRSSQSITATLKDYTLGSFKNCVTPTVATQLKKTADNSSLSSPANPASAQIPSVAAGTQVYDTATLSGVAPGATAQGSVTYTWYNDPACQTAAGTSGPLNLAGGSAPPSANVAVSGTNAYYFKASYSGDLNLGGLNQPSTSGCQDANEQVKSFVPTPHLTIAKSTATPTVSAGSPISYTVTLTNDAPAATGTAATGVTLSDMLPGNGALSWSVASQSAPAGVTCSVSGSPQVLQCGPAFSLDLGQTVAVTVQSPTAAAACGSYSNQASASSSNGGAVSSSIVSISVLCPDVTVLKTADAGTISAGDVAGFAIVVSNAGPGAATGVTLSDALPAGLTWSMSPSVSACKIAAGTLSCAFGSLAPGASQSVHVQATTSAAVCGQLSNTATVAAANEPAANQGNNTSTANIAVNCASVVITKTADSPGVSAGDRIGFTVTVTNNGAGNAYGVTAADTLPNNAGLSWSVDAANSDAGCSISAGSLSCNFGTLGPGAGRHVHITSPTTPATCGSVNNAASASTSNAGNAGPANASIAVNCPDVMTAKSADNSIINAGDVAGFSIIVSNLSKMATARGVVLTDPLPAGATWSVSPAVASCGISSGTLSCTFGDLAPGQSASVHVSGALTSTSNCSPLLNTASASSTNERASDTGNNSSSASITVNCASIGLVKVADAPSVSAGDTVGFKIMVANSGAGTARSVTVHDALPANSGLSWSIDAAGSDAGCAISAGALNCSFGDIASLGSRSVHITSGTTPATCGTVTNTASASATNDGTGTDTASIAVNCPDVTVTKTADTTPISAGDIAAFTIGVHNVGAGTSRNTTLTDVLPGGGSWSVSPAVAGCGITSGTLSCSFGDLAAGDSVTIHVTRASSAADCPSLANTATVAAANERTVDQSNNSSSATIVVNCANIQIAKVADAAAVNAGNPIGFTVTVSNSGAGIARTVTVSDPLPTAGGLSWSIDAAHSDPGCVIASGSLTCGYGDVAPSGSRHVHITSGTSSATCLAGDGTGTVTNTASVTTANAGSGSASASTIVRCSNLTLTKTAGSASVDAGSGVSFAIDLSNSNASGTGTAIGVTLTDPLPSGAGVSWTVDPATTTPTGVTCAISGSAPNQALNCGSGGDGRGTFALLPGQSVHAMVKSGTGPAMCGLLSNTATASAPFNVPSTLTASAATNVRCGSTMASTPSAPFGTVGIAIHDMANVGGSHPTGTVTFALYGPGDTTCSTNLVAGNAAFTGIAVSNGAATSPDFTTTTVGVYQWVARYSGDANNMPSTGTCGDPSEQVVTSAVLAEISLPPTGSLALALIIVGLPLILFGLVLLVIGRRRRGEA